MAEKGLFRKVRLLLDRVSAKKVETDAQRALSKGTDPKRAEKNLSRVNKGLGRLRSAAVKLGAAIGAAFAIRGLARFGRESVRIAAEADAIWTRLGGTLQTVGIEMADVRGEIDEAARAMQNASTVGDEDFAQILQGLIVVSGDYEESLRNVSLTANLAAGTQMDMVAASRLVGRAMIGDTATLKRYGIVVGEGEDAIAAMRRQFAGLAENEARSLQGRLKQINNEWSDFKQAVGDAIAGSNDDGLVAVRNAIREVTTAINENREALSGIGQSVAGAVGMFATLIRWSQRWRVSMIDAQISWNNLWAALGSGSAKRANARLQAVLDELRRAALRLDEQENEFNNGAGAGGGGEGGDGDGTGDPNKALKDRIALLGRARKLNVLNSAQISEIMQLEQATRDELAEGNLTLERRVELMDQLATLEDLSSGLVFQEPRPEVEPVGTLDLSVAGSVSSIHARQQTEIEALAAMYREQWADVEAAGLNAAYGVAGAWQDALGIIGEEGANVGAFLESALRGMAAAGLGGLAQFASAKIAENIALFFDNTAKAKASTAAALMGFPTAGVAAAFYADAARGNLLATAKWGVVAGGAGAGQAMAGGGGRGGLSGGVPTGAVDIGGRIADRQRTAAEVHIYIDPLTGQVNNPEFQDVIGATVDRARAAHGQHARISVHPRTRGPS